MFTNPQKNLLQLGVHESMRIAEFGVGAGYYVFPAASLVGVTGKVYAIDIQSELLRKIKNEAKARNFENIEIICSDLEKEHGSKLKDGSVDAIIVANTLFQIENKAVLAKEAKRILKKKGRVMVVEWSDSFAGLGPHENNVVKKNDALTLFKDSGFELLKEIPAGDHHYGLLFINPS